MILYYNTYTKYVYCELYMTNRYIRYSISYDIEYSIVYDFKFRCLGDLCYINRDVR